MTARTDYVKFGVGFIKYEEPSAADVGVKLCREWDSDVKDAYFDAVLKFGKAMGIVAGIFGLVLFILSCILCCLTFPPIVVKIMAGGYLVMAAASILMLVALASDTCTNICNSLDYSVCTSCKLELGTGCYLAIVAFIFFVGAGIATFFLKETEPVTSEVRNKAMPEAAAKDEEMAVPESALRAMSSVAPTIETVEKINDDGTKTVTTTTTKINPDGSKNVHTTIEKVAL